MEKILFAYKDNDHFYHFGSEEEVSRRGLCLPIVPVRVVLKSTGPYMGWLEDSGELNNESITRTIIPVSAKVNEGHPVRLVVYEISTFFDAFGMEWVWDGDRVYVAGSDEELLAKKEDPEWNGYHCMSIEDAIRLLHDYGFMDKEDNDG